MRPSTFFRSSSLLLNQGRKFSSALKEIDENFLEIRVPKNIAEEFYHRSESYYKGLNGNFKPFSQKEFYQCSKELEDVILKNDPRFLDALEEAKQMNPFLILASGIKVPNISEKEIPTDVPQMNSNKNLLKTIRLAEASSAAYSHLLGFKSDDFLQGVVTGCIFATKDSEDKIGNYRSSVDLGWHNDSWRKGEIMPRISLLGIVGSKEAQTQFIPSQKIIEYFYKHEKADLLESLRNYCYVEEISEDYLEPQAKILDEKGKICFAEYGSFRSSFDPKFQEAVGFICKALQDIEPYKVSIMGGDLTIWNNEEGLHRRVNPNPSLTNKNDLVKKRLVVRRLGEHDNANQRNYYFDWLSML